ncbi:CAMK/CAMK-unique protein kinase [Amanita muscaria]
MLQYPVQLPPLSIHNNRFTSRSPFSSLPLSLTTNLPTPPSSARFSKLPYNISSRPSSRPLSIPNPPLPISQPPSRPASFRSSLIEDVLSPGDFVGEGSLLQGEFPRLVPIGPDIAPSRSLDYTEPATEFQVVRRLGTGSYAVVYLVQEVLSRPPPSEDGHMSTIGQMEFDGNKPSHHSEVVYGREYAIKCLSKANLDEDALAAQMTEVTIHQSLKSHPNIVTLHRTLETSSFLLLVLEYVPGEDLFYFLEQARDHYDSDPRHSDSRTPPTPSLLSNSNPSQLLSRTRLRLIASMFSQMCDAVAACHDQQVFHRDIKPENFIVTDGWMSLPDGRQERKVIVKLSDFGLSSTDVESSDMDCGSAPYMSYECRNNVAPMYRPRAADVWSLGIVLINMLYHCNPWTDTEQGACPSFDLYLRDPVNFFINRFVGMTRSVAEFLATRIFCVLENPSDDSQRISANEFGLWVKNLPTSLGGHGMQRTPSNSSTQGHPLHVSMPVSHRPSSRHPSGCASTTRTPAIPARTLSRAPSLGPAYERDETNELSTILDHEPELEDQPARTMDADDAESRSTSHQKRRKRGTRKGKGAMTLPEVDTLATLAGVTQNLARELSKTSMASSKLSAATKTSSSSQRTRQSHEPVSMYAMPTHLLATSAQKSSSSRPLAAPSLPPVTKKPSKWKLGFGKTSSVTAASDEFTASSSLDLGSTGVSTSTTATNVSNLIMSLNPAQAQPIKTEDESGARGRRSRGAFNERPTLAEMDSERATSPHSNRSGRPLASGASSIASSNWRASMSTTSSAGASTSAFTRYSNSSARSISTAATSVSSTSWRTSVKSTSNHTTYSTLPKNVKPMTGVPWELDEVPRGQYPFPHGDIFGSPPQPRKQRPRKQKDPKLDTISERPTGHKAAEHQRRDASTSTTDLARLATAKDDSEQTKRLPKGQINALAKMLSALRR